MKRNSLPGQPLMEGVVLTGAKDSSMPRHRHTRSHEAIHVIEGSARLRLDDREFVLQSGDYASVPPGTPHTFQLNGNTTRFIQFHAPELNEPFFRYMCDSCEDYTFLQPPPPFRFDRVMQHLGELDLKFLAEQPPSPPGPE